MGLFDFLRKRKGTQATAGGLSEPRTQHYVFAHVVLRQLAFERPLEVVGTLHTDDGPKFLQALWADVAAQVRAGGQPADIDGSDLAFGGVRVGDFPCAVIRMPSPMAPTECYYVAIVLHVKLDGSDQPLKGQPEVSYFTLERGVTMDGGERTVLCGWDAAGTHLNYGDGPPPDPDAFAAALKALLAGRRELHASFRPEGPGGGPNQPSAN
jgi:hypothetical protein